MQWSTSAVYWRRGLYPSRLRSNVSSDSLGLRSSILAIHLTRRRTDVTGQSRQEMAVNPAVFFVLRSTGNFLPLLVPIFKKRWNERDYDRNGDGLAAGCGDHFTASIRMGCRPIQPENYGYGTPACRIRSGFSNVCEHPS